MFHVGGNDKQLAGCDNGIYGGMYCETSPGPKTDVFNNTYMAFTNSIAIMHTAGLFPMPDFPPRMDILIMSARIDVLLVDCKALDLPQIAEYINPKIIITNHENDLQQPSAERKSFSDTLALLSKVGHLSIVMACGEKYTFTKQAKS